MLSIIHVRTPPMKTKYRTIYDDIKNQINDGTYKAGDRLPDELTMCQKYDCSRMTVKKAYDMLVDEGSIYRKQGQGSFVLDTSSPDGEIEIMERDLSGFTRASRGGHVTSKVVHFSLIFADKKIAEKLDIRENDPVYDILRVRYYNGDPYTLEHTYMSPSVIPGITEDILNRSIYSYIEMDLGKRIGAAKKTSRADASTQLDQEELNLKPTEPVLEVEQVAYLDNGVPFEYSISRHRYDKFRFSLYSVRR